MIPTVVDPEIDPEGAGLKICFEKFSLGGAKPHFFPQSHPFFIKMIFFLDLSGEGVQPPALDPPLGTDRMVLF